MNFLLAEICFGIAGFFSAMTWVLQWLPWTSEWFHKKFTMMGVNIRAQMKGIYRP